MRRTVIVGEAGIGKTTVCLEGMKAADARGFRVLQARPAESEAKLSYAALADLVGEAFDQTREALPAPQQRALGAALLRTEADEPADARTTASISPRTRRSAPMTAMPRVTIDRTALGPPSTRDGEGPHSRGFVIAGAGFEQTSTTAYRFVEVREVR